MKRSVLLNAALLTTALAVHAVPTIYVTSGDDIVQYHAGNGNFLGILGSFPGISVGAGSDEFSLGPDGALYSIGNNGVWRTDIETATASPFVTFGDEVTVEPGGIAFGDDGFLYVTAGDDVLRYDATTGAFVGVVGTFPGFSTGSLSDDLTFGPDGALYSNGNNGSIWRLDLETATASPLVTLGPEAIQAQGGFVFGNDGHLYVSVADDLLRYDAQTGELLGVVGSFPGAFSGSYLDNLVLGQDGMIYSQSPAGIWRINVHSGTATELIHFGPEVTMGPGGFAIVLP